MKVSIQQIEKLFKLRDLNFQSLGFSMLVTRLKILHAKAPTEHTLGDCTAAINSFLDRFKDAVAEDYELITKL